MSEATIHEMLRRDHDEWIGLMMLLDRHAGGPVHDPESPDWEARHVYAHFARWLNFSMDDFEAVLTGRPRPPKPEGDDDSVNARWRDEDDSLEFGEARARSIAAYSRRVQLIESVPPDGWTPLLHEIARADGFEHIGAHREYIGAALERPDR